MSFVVRNDLLQRCPFDLEPFTEENPPWAHTEEQGFLHPVHLRCMLEWVNRQSERDPVYGRRPVTCPSCRFNISDEQVQAIRRSAVAAGIVPAAEAPAAVPEPALADLPAPLPAAAAAAAAADPDELAALEEVLLQAAVRESIANQEREVHPRLARVAPEPRLVIHARWGDPRPLHLDPAVGLAGIAAGPAAPPRDAARGVEEQRTRLFALDELRHGRSQGFAVLLDPVSDGLRSASFPGLRFSDLRHFSDPGAPFRRSDGISGETVQGIQRAKIALRALIANPQSEAADVVALKQWLVPHYRKLCEWWRTNVAKDQTYPLFAENQRLFKSFDEYVKLHAAFALLQFIRLLGGSPGDLYALVPEWRDQWCALM